MTKLFSVLKSAILGLLIVVGSSLANAQSSRVGDESTGSDGSRRSDTNVQRLGALCDSLQVALDLTVIDVVPIERTEERSMQRVDEDALRQTLLEMYAQLGWTEELPERFTPRNLNLIFDAILEASAVSTPQVQTLVADGLTQSLAILRGRVSNDGGQTLQSWGFKFGTDSELSDSSLVPFGAYTAFLDTSANDTGAFYLEKSGLARYTTYYYAAWAENGEGVEHGDTLSFTTLPDLASGLTLDTSLVTATSATLKLSISDAGGQGPDAVGFYWDDSNFTLETFAGDSLPSDSATGTAHAAQVNGLTRMTTYHFNAYADNLAGRAWADEHFSFTTLPEPPAFDSLYADLTVDSLYALLADDGGQTPTLSRFFYSTTNSDAELVTDSVDAQLNGTTLCAPIASASLFASQDYALNAFSENSAGRATADAASFFTPAIVLTSESVTNQTDSTASIHASFVFGNRMPTFGFKWGLNADLSGATVSPVAIAADSTIQLDLDGLAKDSTYYFAAYADNGNVQFGDTLSFVAMTIVAPTISSTAPEFVTSTRTTLEGDVANNGGAEVTDFGFVWGTDAALLSAATVTGDSASATGFSKAFIGLDPETTYYYSAFATNAAGTGYSDTLSFTTPGTVTFDGFTYSLVKLDTSYWFVESLRNTHFANGDEIPHMPDTDEWSSTFFPGYSNPAGDDSTKVNDWGRLYNYYAYEDTRGICPTDWHPASYSDLNGMRMTLDLDDEADYRSSAEDSPAWDGTNRTGFSALPVGFRTNAGNYSSTEGYAGSEANLFWVSLWGGKARFFRMVSSWMPLGGELASSPEQLRAGYSIRCVQGAPDTGGDLPLVTTSGASDTTSVSISLTGVMTDGGTGYVSALGFAWSTDPGLANPQYEATYTTTEPFTMSIEDLEPSTTYYYAAFGRNGWGTAYGDTLSFTTNPWECGSTWDYNDVTYQTVEAFGDCWFAQNLATDRFANGDSIPTGLTETDWEMTLDPAWTALGANATEQASYLETHGGLYNFLAVNDARGLCPTGWHVASSQEWWDLKDSLTDPSSASEMKATAPAWNGTNETGISLLPSGYYRPNISYDNTDGEMRAYVSQGFEEYTSVWTASASLSGSPIAYYIGDFLNDGQFSLLQMGRTIRCVQGDMGPVEVLAPVIQPQHIHVDSIGATAAVVAFGITEDWGNAITQAKVRIGEDRITTETFSALSVDADTIQIEVTNLSPNTQYWYQTIAQAGDKIGYGYWQTFTTSLDVPTMGTLAATNLGPNFATLNGSVDSDGGGGLSATGFIWGTNASLATTTSVAGSSTSGGFTASLTGLDPTTTYYYSAFGTNSVGTDYGDTLSFVTPSYIVAEVTTSEATDITAFTGMLNGTVGYDGGAEVTATGFVWSADSAFTAPQDIAGSATSGDFSAEITGLTLDSTYYYTAYATNAAGTAYGDTLSFVAAEPQFLCGSAGTLNYNGHEYRTIHRGNQCWFAENLATETYANGDTIPMVTSGWNVTTTAARTPLSNDTANVALYGWLYNWHAVVDTVRGLCPTDWHVSTDEDWQVLEDGLGATYAGRSLKSKSTDTPPWNGYNSIGFSALPGGYRTDGGTHTNGGVHGYFWTSTEATSTKAWDRYIYNTDNVVYRNSYSKRGALSVRCVKFYPARPPAVMTDPATNITRETVQFNGYSLANGGGNITSRGFVFGMEPNLSDGTTKIASGEPWTTVVSNLQPSTTYYYTAYAANTYGMGYGDTLSFTTAAAIAPTLITMEVVAPGDIYARLGGEVLDDGSAEITSVGFAISTESTLSSKNYLFMNCAEASVNEFQKTTHSLAPGTTYYCAAYATNSAGTSYGDTISFTTTPAFVAGDTVSYNGYDYPTVAIGNNIWFAENLRTTNYSNGDAIPYKSSSSQWAGTTAGAQCYYNSSSTYLNNHGRIYNGYAIMDERGLCPAGWMVPLETEANTLSNISAHKASPSDNPSWDGTNTSGFGMAPGGYRHVDGTFQMGNTQVYWATSRTYSDISYFVRYWQAGTSGGIVQTGNKAGSYVRCKRAITVTAYVMPAENVTSTSADLIARVPQWPGGAQVEEAWITWSTSSLFDPEVAPVNVDCVEYTGEVWGSNPYEDIAKVSLTDLQPNTTYYYRVHTVNVAGERVSLSDDFTTTE